MSTTSTATVTAAEAADAVAKVLAESGHPLTFAQIKAAYPGPGRLTDQRLRGILKELIQGGRAFLNSPEGRHLRYGSRNEEQRAAEKLRGLLKEEPQTEEELVEALGSELGSGASPAWRARQVQKLREGEGVYLHPPMPPGKAVRLSLTPPDPIQYIPGGCLDTLTRVFERLEKFNLSRRQILDALDRHLATHRATDAGAGAEEGSTAVAERAELKDLLKKGVLEIEQGAVVSLRELRRSLPAEYQEAEAFNRAVLELAEGGEYVLHPHDAPDGLSEEERQELVPDGLGNYFTGISRKA
jgi:hypothetical protein